MKNNTWIIIFFAALAGYIIGMQIQDRHESFFFKGGRSYRINFKKNVDPDKVRMDLSKTLKDENPIIKTIGDNKTLDIITTYMINRSGPQTDSIVLAKLMVSLKKYLPTGITYEQFDREYKLGYQMVLPVGYDRRPGQVKKIVYPFLQYGCKALLMPLLFIFLLVSLKRIPTNLKRWILLALFFSWAGDVLLMFEPKDKIFFLLGLSSFLLAHIFYIVFFHFVRVKEKIKGNPWLLVVVVIYYAVLINFLSPYLADMKIPVLVYGIVISVMLMMAMHMLFIKNKPAGKWMMIGALMFVMSDSILAINKFYQPFATAVILIILTYGLAQLFIVKGAADYINSVDKK